MSKERKRWLALSFPFLLCHYLQFKWLGNRGSKSWVGKDMIGFLGCLCFLEHHCILCAFEANLRFEWKLTSPHPCFPNHRCKTLTLYSLWVSLSSQPSFHWNFFAHGQTLHANGAARIANAHTALSCLPTRHCPLGLHFQSTSSKITLLRISIWQQQSIQPHGGPFWAQGPMQLGRSRPREASPILITASQVERVISIHSWACQNPETEKNLPTAPRAVVELEFKQSLFLTRLSVWLVWRNEITTR